MSFVELIVDVHRRLAAAGLDHAFAGALALMHHVREPRTTWDIDVNISVDASGAERVRDALEGLAAFTDDHLTALQIDHQVRVFAGRYPIDIFLVAHEFHDDVRLNTEWFRFGETELPYISATHLTVFKVLYDRPKDWVYIEEMVRAGTVDAPKALGWLVTLLGDDARIARLRALFLAEPTANVSVKGLFRSV